MAFAPGAAPLHEVMMSFRATPSAWASMLAAALILGVLLGYAVNLAREIARPRLAGALEAERVTALPGIAIIRGDAGRRRAVTDVDPFRLAYLSVSPAGNRAHSIVLTGDDPRIVAVIAARIARAAADDARATLVLDLDLERSPVAAQYHIRREPGLTDAILGVRLWREVALPIGASSGLSIDVVPSGVLRREADAMHRTPELDEFLGEHDFCIFVASGARALRRAAELMPHLPTILCVHEGVTSLGALATWRGILQSLPLTAHGTVVWAGSMQDQNL